MTNKPHLDFLDLAKGIGILLVVFGHGMFPNHFLIDSFHMPMFLYYPALILPPPQ